jgi:hypothetical protein
MKKMMAITLVSLATMTMAHADYNPGRPGMPGRPGFPGGPGDGELRTCQFNLARELSVSQILRNNLKDDEIQIQQLRAENFRLADELRKRDENRQSEEERRREEDRRREEERRRNENRSLGFFSYAGCSSFNGNIDTKFIASGVGSVPLMSETNAKSAVSKAYSCNYGVKIGKTEEILSNAPQVYCVAGCQDFSGNVDSKFIQAATGRNTTEAEYLAIKAVSSTYSCNYGVKLQACQ